MTTSITAQTRPQSWKHVRNRRSRYRDASLANLETAKKRVVDRVGVDLFARVLRTGPSPHVFLMSGVLGVLENGCADNPHNEAEEEETDRECGIVDGDLLGATMSAFPVAPENDQTRKQRETSQTQ